jgi:hypothetical protein
MMTVAFVDVKDMQEASITKLGFGKGRRIG